MFAVAVGLNREWSKRFFRREDRARIAGFPAHALVEKSDLSFTSGNGKSRAPQDKLETVQFVVVGIKVPDLIPGDDDLISNIGSHR